MTTPNEHGVDVISDNDIETLKRFALAATPQDIDSAEDIDRYTDGSHVECPACGGEGSVPRESEFCNYDGEVLGIQFFGIGDAVGTAEAYFRAAKPATILALIARLERTESALLAASSSGPRDMAPVPMLLFCPRCGEQHIDAPEEREYDAGLSTHTKVRWANPPHRSHLCHACECIWRPADVATVGVATIETSGKADTWTVDQGSVADVALAVQGGRDALSCSPSSQSQPDYVYTQLRECDRCGHMGINVGHETNAACRHSCGWSGPSPIEDKCPGCGETNCMEVACPKCSGPYTLLADGRLPTGTVNVSVIVIAAEAVGWFDKELNTIRWKDGIVNADFSDRQPFYTEPPVRMWSNEPPTEQGLYWHWTGDLDARPIPLNVLWSGSTKKCFISAGQYGITEAVDCDAYGGYWQVAIRPKMDEEIGYRGSDA